MAELRPTGKPASQSITIRGAAATLISAVAMLIAFVLSYFGFDVPAEEIAGIITSLVAVVGSLLAIFGRKRATEKIR